MTKATHTLMRPLWIGPIALAGLFAASHFGPLPAIPGWLHGHAAPPVSTATPAALAPPTSARWNAPDSTIAGIEATIGQLQVRDEAALDEPLLGMRGAERQFQASPDPRYQQQIAYWADLFCQRLAALAIPERTRTGLEGRLAAYQRDVLGVMDTVLAARFAEAARPAIADRLLTAEHSGETAASGG